jgi:coenzyme F420-reducing hydrogenase alpha subunit
VDVMEGMAKMEVEVEEAMVEVKAIVVEVRGVEVIVMEE